MRITMNWAAGVVVTYALFAAGTIGVVVFAMTQPVELVSADYYAQSLGQDERMAATRRADALGDGVRAALTADGHTLFLDLPADQAPTATGTVTWYRPSSSAGDVTLPLALTPAGAQRIPTTGLARGRWIVRVDWTANGAHFFREQAVTLP